jgi:hypothetical protein
MIATSSRVVRFLNSRHSSSYLSIRDRLSKQATNIISKFISVSCLAKLQSACEMAVNSRLVG